MPVSKKEILRKKQQKLENHAGGMQKLMRQFANRAFVIEFSGTPKSGKTTSSEAIRHFLSRNDFRVHVLSERAALCPIPMKGHLYFNTWCFSSMIAELLQNVEAETDIIIIDRGLFDALIWMNMQKSRGELTKEESNVIENFILLDRWRKLIDLSVVMSVSNEEAINRENRNHITSKLGSIMNHEVLKTINKSIKSSLKLYKNKFNRVIVHETGLSKDIKESNIDLAENLLKCLETFINPKILVVPKKYLLKLPMEEGGCFEPSAIIKAYKYISKYGMFIYRSKAELNPHLIQIVPCSMLMHNDKIFVFQRRDIDPKYHLYGKTTIWQGCHVPIKNNYSIPKLMKESLRERLGRSLFLSRIFPMEEFGYCWDKNDTGSVQHFGFIYKIDINNNETAMDLKKKEFRKQRGHGLVGKFEHIKTIKSQKTKLGFEIWSETIIKHLIKERG